MLDETPPKGERHVGGAAGDPEVRERAGLRQIPQDPSRPGALAGSLTKAFDQANPKDLSSTPGTPYKLEKGDHVVIKMPEDSWPTISRTVELDLGAGEEHSYPKAKIGFADPDYIRRETTPGGFNWVVAYGREPGTVTLNLLGTEIAFNLFSNATPEAFGGIQDSDIKGLESVARFLSEEDRNNLNLLIQKAQDKAVTEKSQHDASEAERLKGSDSPIFIQIGRGKSSVSDEEGIVVQPISDRPDFVAGVLTPNPYQGPRNSAQAVFHDISKQGVFLPVDGKPINYISRSHLVIKLDPKTRSIELIDGDGTQGVSANGTIAIYKEENLLDHPQYQ